MSITGRSRSCGDSNSPTSVQPKITQSASAARVTLRLIFDDPHHPDFDLDLWLAGDEARRRASSPAEAMQEANRWLARAEAILRRPVSPRAGATPTPDTLSTLRPSAEDERGDLDHDDPPFHLDNDERLI